MTKPLKLIAVGNSTGIILPKELLARLRVAQGGALFVSEMPDGDFRLTANDPDFAKKMRMADKIMREDRDILHVLAQ